MPDDKELGAINTKINRWLEGVETAKHEGTLRNSGEAVRPVSNLNKNNTFIFHTTYCVQTRSFFKLIRKWGCDNSVTDYKADSLEAASRI